MISENNENVLSKIGKLLYYIVITFVCLIAAFLLFYIISSQMNANNEDYKPKVSIYTIVSPSMTPVIKVYDVVVNVRVDKPEDIKVGDIITYTSRASTSEGMTITHRVKEVSKTPDGSYEYQTQGDNNSEPDALYVSFDQVIGKEILIIPFLGRVQFLIANQKGWLFLLLIPVSIYTFAEIYKLFNLFGVKKRVRYVVKTEEKIASDEQKAYEEEIIARKERIKEELRIKQEINNIPIPTTKEEIDLYKTNSYEILDTDELTTKIKAYDDKINELDKALQNIAFPEEEPPIIEENFLKGDRIKVVDVETAKKRKPKNPKPAKVLEAEAILEEPIDDNIEILDEPKETTSNRIIDVLEEEKHDNINYMFEDIVPIENTRTKIERPDSEDIKTAKEREITQPKPQTPNKKKSLNLNPRRVKKVRRVSNQGRRSRNLALNPNNIKRVNRGRQPKPKKKIIVIEKTK